MSDDAPTPPPRYTAAEPPEILYHSVAADELDDVLARGIVPTGRPHVHLARRPEHARSAIREESRPVMLEVRALELHRAGGRFFVSPKGTWLTDAVPSRYFSVME